jgi:hypothetical protein
MVIRVLRNGLLELGEKSPPVTVPVMGTVKTLSLSALTGLVTVRAAVSAEEHCVPHCGVKVMVMRHEPPDARLNG